MRHYILAITLVAALALFMGCGDDPAPMAIPPAMFKTVLVLKNSSGNEAAVFNSSAEVTMELTLTNISNTPQKLRFPTSQVYELEVRRDGTKAPIWTWSTGKTFLPTDITLTFEVNETHTWTQAWGQIDDAGSPVGVGNYSAVGYMHVYPDITHFTGYNDTTRSKSVSFDIY